MMKETKTDAHASPADNDTSFKGVPSGVPAAISLLTVLVFTVSAAREWAYYRVLGADFISLASPVDYASATLRELPLSIALLGVGAGLSKIYFLITVGAVSPSDKEIAQRQRHPFLGYLLFTFMAVAGFAMAWILYVRTGDNPAKGWLLPVFGCWGVFILWFGTPPHPGVLTG